jgi:spermidine/putrescine transport system permease protein
MIALGNTVLLAVISAVVSTIIGTLGAIGAYYSKRRMRNALDLATQIPVVNAEIVVAFSLTVMFVFLGKIFKAMGGDSYIFSFWTLLIGHCCLSLPFVYISVKPKLQQMDPSLYEAALDLGASPTKALFKVIVPEIMPGVLSGFLLSITLSLDDFIVTAFTRGSGLLSGSKNIETLSTLVQAKIKKGPIPPEMRALTTILFVAVIAAVIGITIYRNHQEKKLNLSKRRAG